MRADLGSLAASLKAAPLKDLATARAGQASLSAAGWTADLSRQYLDAESDAALLAHGAKAGLEGAAASLFNGDIVNPSENRPALHWALRAQAPLAGEAEKVRQSVLPALEFARRVQDVAQRPHAHPLELRLAHAHAPVARSIPPPPRPLVSGVVGRELEAAHGAGAAPPEPPSDAVVMEEVAAGEARGDAADLVRL